MNAVLLETWNGYSVNAVGFRCSAYTGVGSADVLAHKRVKDSLARRHVSEVAV